MTGTYAQRWALRCSVPGFFRAMLINLISFFFPEIWFGPGCALEGGLCMPEGG